MSELSPREKLQREASLTWANSPDLRGMLEVATRSGKTITSFRCIGEAIKLGRLLPKPKVYFLAEVTGREVDMRNDLENELPKYTEFSKDTFGEVNFLTYHSNPNIHYEDNTVYILDEVHDCATSKRKYIIENLYTEGLPTIALTATPMRDIKVHRDNPSDFLTKGNLYDEFLPTIYTYSMEKAKRDKIWKPFNFTTVLLQLDTVESDLEYGWKNNKVKGTERDFYNWNYNQSQRVMKDWKLPHQEKVIRASRFWRAYGDLLTIGKTKVKAAKKILSILDGVTLVLAKDNRIFPLIGIPYLSAKTKVADKRANAQLLEDFKAGLVPFLGSSKFLSQGSTLKSIDNIVILSYTSSKGYFEQKASRGLTYVPDKVTNMYVFQTLDTQESLKWFPKATKGILPLAEEHYRILL